MDGVEVRLLVMDVDGTLTDGRIHVGPGGELFKSFDVKDGLGIARLRSKGVRSAIITGRESEIVLARARELGIEFVRQGVSEKLAELERVLEKAGVGLDRVAYIGDDINDIDCIEAVNEAGGITGCPSDAVSEVRGMVSYVCGLSGGNGAVREFIENAVGVNRRPVL